MSAASWDREAARRTLILGQGRQELALPEGFERGDASRSALGFAAALGLRSRFDRAARPDLIESPPVDWSERRLLGPVQRARLRALLGDGRDVREVVALRVLDETHQHGWSLHPFDLPRLTRLMRFDSERLDAEAALWLASQSGSAAREAGRSTPDDEDRWESLTPVQRAGHLRRLRERDPGAARALCEAEIGSQTATVRCKWLQAMSVALGSEDVAFLEPFAADRAKSVVQAATQLLIRIPGTRFYDEALAEARSRLRASGKRLTRRRKQLDLVTPKHLKARERWDWIFQSFSGVDPAALAASFDVAEVQLADAVRDPSLRAALYYAAVTEHRAELAGKLGATVPEDEMATLLARGFDRAEPMDARAREILADTALLPERASDLRVALSNLGHFYRLFRIPISQARADAMLASKEVHRGLEKIGDEKQPVEEALLPNCVAALPRARLARAVELLETLPLAVMAEARDLALLLTSLAEGEQPA